MKTLILYHSAHGAGDKCTELMAERLKGEVRLVNLRREKAPTIKDFNRIIIGSNIHMGRMNKKVDRFCSSHLSELLNKEVGLFFCCLTPEEEGQEYYVKNFPPPLVEHAKALGILGGALYFEKMNFFESLMLKKITGAGENRDTIDSGRIQRFVEELEA